jgi:dTDP-4-dehydrorhamnose 3,5-epimerase
MMQFQSGSVADAWVVDLERRGDERGFFARMWCETEFANRGLVARISQINTGFSHRAGTLRGMHFQRRPHEEVKVVRCLRGSVFDVIVDLRPGSATYRRWMGVELSCDNGRMLYVPEGCAHGYITLEDSTELMYFASRPYAPDAASGVRFDDQAFGIAWPIKPLVVSQADRSWPDFEG